MVISKMSLDILAGTIKKLILIKTTTFWSHEFLKRKEKRNLYYEMTAFVVLHLLLWLFALTIIIGVLVSNASSSNFVFNDEWPFLSKIIFKLSVSITTVFGYFTGNATECYYAYIVLHNYFQMRILMVFVRQAVKKFKERSLKQKIFDNTYQLEVQEILRQTIEQFQRLKLLV